MKAFPISILLTCLLLVSCVDEPTPPEEASSPKKETAAPEGAKKTAKDTSDELILKQNGDYSALFYHTNDSSITSETEIAEALKISKDRVGQLERPGGVPTFSITLSDGTKSLLSINVAKLERKVVYGAIKNHVQAAESLKAMRAEISDTGDSWICTHGFNKWVLIYNTNYDAKLLLNFFHEASGEGKGFTAEQKEEARINTAAIANMLLKKFQKEKVS